MCAADVCQVCETARPTIKLVASRLADGRLLDAVLLCGACARRLTVVRDRAGAPAGRVLADA